MNGFGTFVDIHDILGTTAGANRDQAMKVRDALRYMLRAVEDIHGFPRSFETRAERDQRAAYGGLLKRDEYHDPT